MPNELLAQVYQHPLFTKDDLETIASVHSRVEKAKGTFLLKEGSTANYYYILEKGVVRCFVHNYEGADITVGFACAGDIVIEVASLFQRIPTVENIQCITDCTLWQISYDEFQQLFHSIPACREWGRSWMAYELSLAKVRATAMITLSAKQRYHQLSERYPDVLQQVPLKYIASYLGVTDTSLSRIRKELAQGNK